MIQIIIFDLDGTLVQTEILKARSYARAAVELNPVDLSEAEVVEAFKDVVGLSRHEVAEKLLVRFHLTEFARARMAEFGVHTPWQAFVQIRLKIYDKLLADPQTLRQHLCPHNVGLLNYARKNNYLTGLATMSHCQQVNRVLDILDLKDKFDFIATRDDVENGKPDPEIYLLISRHLQTPPDQCLVIEDSLTGIKAAIAAGMHCIAVSTDFTRESLHQSGLIPESRIIDDSRNLLSVATHILSHKQVIN